MVAAAECKRPACPLCRDCCVEDSVHYRIMDTIGLLVTKRRKRRVWSDEEKRMICGQARVLGVSVVTVTALVDTELMFPAASTCPSSEHLALLAA